MSHLTKTPQEWLEVHVSRGSIAGIDLEIRRGANINDAEGLAPPLILAVEAKKLETVRHLIELGADINIRRKHDDFTPLMCAIAGAPMLRYAIRKAMGCAISSPRTIIKRRMYGMC